MSAEKNTPSPRVEKLALEIHGWKHESDLLYWGEAADEEKVKATAAILARHYGQMERELAQLKDKCVAAAWAYGKATVERDQFKARAEKAEAELAEERTYRMTNGSIVTGPRAVELLEFEEQRLRKAYDEIAELKQRICVDTPKMLAINAELLDQRDRAESERDQLRQEAQGLREEVERLKEEIADERERNCVLRGVLETPNTARDGRVVESEEVADLRAQLAAAQEDVARIDWLDENMGHNGGGKGGRYWFDTPADVECGMLRVAIDAARAKDQAWQEARKE